MHLRQCRECGKVCKVPGKWMKLCNECHELVESIRVEKIKITNYKRLTITHQKVYNTLVSRREEINKENGTKTD